MTEPFTRNTHDLLWHELKAAGGRRIQFGFSLRTGGSSGGVYTSMNLGLHVGDEREHVLENRTRLSKRIGIPLARWVCAEQVHGTRINRVTGKEAGSGAWCLTDSVKGADGLYTTDHQLLLALCFADCVPVYFYSDMPAVVGIYHAGWRGTCGGGVSKMVQIWGRQLGIEPDRIHAVIGPAISGSDYEVDNKVISEVEKMHPSIWQDAVQPRANGHYLLDLQAMNRSLLLDAGVPDHQVKVTAYHTNTREDLFYSHRRDRGKTGRMMGFIAMKNEGES